MFISIFTVVHHVFESDYNIDCSMTIRSNHLFIADINAKSPMSARGWLPFAQETSKLVTLLNKQVHPIVKTAQNQAED